MCSANCANRLGGKEGAKQRIRTSASARTDVVLPEHVLAATTGGGLSSPSDSESETSSISDSYCRRNLLVLRSEKIDLTGLCYSSSNDEHDEDEDSSHLKAIGII